MSREEILAALERVNAGRCRPPLPDREVERIAASIARYEPDQVAVAVVENHWAQDQPAGRPPSGTTCRTSRTPGPCPTSSSACPGSSPRSWTTAWPPRPTRTWPWPSPGRWRSRRPWPAARSATPATTGRTSTSWASRTRRPGRTGPRKLNTEILHAVGLASQVGGRFASGEGIQDALFLEPCMLFQTDEIDGMLQSINKARDARHESIMGTLLTMYSSANWVFPMRRKAGKEAPGAIDQPCLVVFGTAIPNHYYEALSERMLTNGFFARMIILECGTRSAGPGAADPARSPGGCWRPPSGGPTSGPAPGTSRTGTPCRAIVPQTEEARKILVETRLEAEEEYAKAEAAATRRARPCGAASASTPASSPCSTR